MLNIILCDDHSEQRNIVKKYISDIITDEEYEILEFESGEDLISNFPEDVSIILLDIQMKTLSGMDVARWIREFNKDVEIIFITGLIDYVQEGYEVRAYRYLLKPVSFEDINKHLSTCITELQRDEEEYLTVIAKGEIHKILIKEIVYIEIFRKELTVFTEFERYTIKMSLEKVECELRKHKFFRCHKSYLVNMKKIIGITSKSVMVSSGEIPLSRYRVKELKSELAEVLGDILC